MSDLVDRIVESMHPMPDGKYVKMASVHKSTPELSSSPCDAPPYCSSVPALGSMTWRSTTRRVLSKKQPYIIARVVELPIPQPCKEMKDQRNV